MNVPCGRVCISVVAIVRFATSRTSRRKISEVVAKVNSSAIVLTQLWKQSKKHCLAEQTDKALDDGHDRVGWIALFTNPNAQSYRRFQCTVDKTRAKGVCEVWNLRQRRRELLASCRQLVVPIPYRPITLVSANVRALLLGLRTNDLQILHNYPIYPLTILQHELCQ